MGCGIRSLWPWRRKAAVTPPLNVELTPHFALFSTPPDFDHGQLRLDNYRGLLYVEALGQGLGKDGCLVTAWRDQAAYAGAEPRFLADQHLTRGNVLWEGIYLDTLVRKKRWWTRWSSAFWNLVTSKGWALAATALLLLQNIGHIGDLWLSMVGPPQVELSGPSRPVDVEMGVPCRFDVSARNVCAFGECEFEFLSVVPATGPDKGLDLDVGTLPHKHPRVKTDLPVSLPVTVTSSQPGNYRVVVSGLARQGAIWKERLCDASVEIRVWKPWEFGPRHIGRIWPGGRVCAVVLELRSGHDFPRGITVRTKVDRMPKVAFRDVQFSGAIVDKPMLTSGAPGSECAVINWTTPALSHLTSKTFYVLLESQVEKTREAWETLVQQIKFIATDSVEETADTK